MKTKGRKKRGRPSSDFKVGHRERMRDHAVAMHAILANRRRISLESLAEEMNMSQTTARRWVEAFSLVMPVRLERGIVVIDRSK